MRHAAAVPALILLALAASASAARPRQAGYLDDASAPDIIAILPPAPAANGPVDTADQAIFKATRGLEGSPRWDLARSDSDEGAILADMSCAAGVPLSAASAPHLAALLERVETDASRAVDAPKDLYQRPRPFFSLPGDICVPRSANKSPDYPSGHSTWGWTVGLILAELDPDRATPILVRARAFGESRVVCGVHNASAVEASRTVASSLVAALHGSPAFRADMDAARTEMASLRAHASPPPAACAVEAALIAKTPWKP